MRLYAHELGCEAWQTLSTDAKALLVELRALYKPSQFGMVFLSVREGCRRLGIGQRRFRRAMDALIERGWVRIYSPGSFTCKIRHATEYRLTNEADASPGAKPTKDYMRWTPTVVHEKAR